MRSKWKVRLASPEGLVEHELVGTLLEIAEAAEDAPVRVLVWVEDVPEPIVDAGRGSDSITIDKKDVGDLGQVLEG